MESSPGFSNTSLFLADSRLVLGILNHLRHQALGRMFGMSRAQSNVLTAVLLLSAADGAYKTTKAITGVRPHVSGADAALSAIAMSDAVVRKMSPTGKAIPGFGPLLALGIAGGLAAPAIRRMAHGMHIAEQRMRATEARVRHERITRYVAARDRLRPKD